MNEIKFQLYIELIKAIITLFFGYISFKIFQRYKNKKDNNKLYIKLIKLESELVKNKCKAETILNNYIEKGILHKYFYINGVYNLELYELYNCIDRLMDYKYVEIVYDSEETMDVEEGYAEKPYQMINGIERDSK